MQSNPNQPATTQKIDPKKFMQVFFIGFGACLLVAALVLGITKGYSDPKDYTAKKAHYALVQEFARRFREANGSIVCRELLRGTGATEGGAPEARTEEYYRKRPCKEIVGEAADILEKFIAEHK